MPLRRFHGALCRYLRSARIGLAGFAHVQQAVAVHPDEPRREHRMQRPGALPTQLGMLTALKSADFSVNPGMGGMGVEGW